MKGRRNLSTQSLPKRVVAALFAGWILTWAFRSSSSTRSGSEGLGSIPSMSATKLPSGPPLRCYSTSDEGFGAAADADDQALDRASSVVVATFHAGWRAPPRLAQTYYAGWLGSSPKDEAVPLPTWYYNWRGSLHAAGFGHVEVLGGNFTWGLEEGANWRGRTEAFRHFAATLDKDAVVIFSDAYDTLAVRGPGALLDAYRTIRSATGSPVVFAAERLCDTRSCRLDPQSRDAMEAMQRRSSARLSGSRLQYSSGEDLALPLGPRAYLNAGFFVGSAGAVVELLGHAVTFLALHPEADDQAAFVHTWLQGVLFQGAPLITLDYAAALVREQKIC